MARDRNKFRITPHTDSGLQKILNLPIDTYRLRATGQECTGPHVDDIKRLFPDAVSGDDMVDYSKLFPHLVLAIQDLYKILRLASSTSQANNLATTLRQEVNNIEELKRVVKTNMDSEASLFPPAPYNGPNKDRE